MAKGIPAKAPDLVELMEAKKFLNLPEKTRLKLEKDNSAEFDRLIELSDKIWSQWQSWFMGQDKDAEHPFINRLFVRRWKQPIGEFLGLKKEGEIELERGAKKP